MTNFNDWLKQQLKDRKLSMRELSRRSGFSHSLVSNILNNKMKPSADFCLSVAETLDVNPVEVLQLADLLPLDVTQDNEPEAYELLSIFRKLDGDRRKQAIEYLRFLNQKKGA